MILLCEPPAVVAGAKVENGFIVFQGPQGRLLHRSMPSGAEVEIDGNIAGVSPLAFVLIKHGDSPRVITIKMNGYKTVEKKVVPDGKTIPIGLTLEKQ